ncbi:hypothetical protein E4U43_004650 [Claviceps pusilla]|uniref:CCZ1/INTU/HSP4 first Longin domain-containing protein n=1 Tax=Claviceps pusilla TaxID=123648 RepID=A0A9P7T1T2_9HYPO|nr:hypothetical protein E4U43_004650 [Claviceps pusilla]
MATATATAAAAGAIVPAQLGFLAIFNPCLGNTDDTLDDQIVYYASDSTRNTQQAQHTGSKRRRTRGRPVDAISQDERNERLRQIGLAQAIISFSRGFADGASLDSVDTEKSRIITHELEPGWWILASINFTQLPLPPRLPVKNAKEEQEVKYEYTSREIKPASLLLRDLLRAHSIFLLHHDTSLSALFVRKRRTKFVAAIGRYWDLFLSTWTVMLRGNPARNIFGGINVAVSGELGVGVGEEQRGSGEREVLEGLVGRIEGLVDLVVSKFGADADTDANARDRENTHDAKVYREQQAASTPSRPWLGTGEEPAAEDGAVFLGIGALSRKSVRDVTHWMEDLYQWGDHAYGVIESPTSTRKARARARRGNKAVVEETETLSTTSKKEAGDQEKGSSEGASGDKTETEKNTEVEQQQPPPPPEPIQDDRDPEALTTATQADASTNAEAPAASDPSEAQDGKLDKMFSYMKLGYGSYWSIPGRFHPDPSPYSSSTAADAGAASTTSTTSITAKSKLSQETASPAPPPPDFRPHIRQHAASEIHGYYLIGLRGSIEEDICGSDSGSGCSESDVRTVVRTINVELEDKPAARADATIVRDFQHPGSALTQSQVEGNMVPGYYNSHDLNKSEKLRVVVYVKRPFIFTFLFRLHTDSLAWPSLYRSLHHQLSPLKKPLLASTAYRPDIAAADSRFSSRLTSAITSATNNNIYNLVWDPPGLTVHSTIPNIPDSHACDDDGAWSRADAINSHLHLLTVHALTRSKHTDLERHQKTNRGWWIIWTRLVNRAETASSDHDDDVDEDDDDGQVQNRHRPDHQDGTENEMVQSEPPYQLVSKEIFLLRRASDHAGLGGLTAGNAGRGSDRASKLVHGIGVDTRRYMEDLLSFL